MLEYAGACMSCVPEPCQAVPVCIFSRTNYRASLMTERFLIVRFEGRWLCGDSEAGQETWT